MKLPFDPHSFDFNAWDIVAWIKQNNPAQIEMTDAQFARLCAVTHTISPVFNGIPILFLDAPKV